MRIFKLIVFLLITGAAVGAAWFVSQQRSATTDVTQQNFLPDLINRVNDVAKIEIKTKQDSTSLSKQGDAWVIDNRNQYPAVFDKVKNLVVSLTQLQVLDAKTKNPALYPRLGVEDVDAKDATSKQVSLADASGKPIAALIVGKDRALTSAKAKPSFYARKAGDAQAFLVQGNVNVSEKPMDWGNTELANIDSKRIREATIDRPGKPPVHIHRKDTDTTDYTLDNIPAEHKVKSQVTLNSVANALESLSFDDIVPAAKFTMPEKDTTVSKYSTFDGLIAIVTTVKVDNKTHARFEFSYDAKAAEQNKAAAKPEETKPADKSGDTKTGADANKDQPGDKKAEESKPAETPAKPNVEEEVKTLNANVKDWIYILPDYKANLLVKTAEELVEPKPKEENKKLPPPGTSPGVPPEKTPGISVDKILSAPPVPDHPATPPAPAQEAPKPAEPKSEPPATAPTAPPATEPVDKPASGETKSDNK